MSECKPTSELLSAIQGADTKGLKDVTPVENPAAKHDMAMVSLGFTQNSPLKLRGASKTKSGKLGNL